MWGLDNGLAGRRGLATASRFRGSRQYPVPRSAHPRLDVILPQLPLIANAMNGAPQFKGDGHCRRAMDGPPVFSF